MFSRAGVERLEQIMQMTSRKQVLSVKFLNINRLRFKSCLNEYEVFIARRFREDSEASEGKF